MWVTMGNNALGLMLLMLGNKWGLKFETPTLLSTMTYDRGARA